MKPVYIKGLENASDSAMISSAIRDIILKATGNLSWLSYGDTVLLKPAINSADPYPSTTHPLAVSVTAALLAERGARVVIGDHPYIRHGREIGLGTMPRDLVFEDVPAEV